MDEFLWYREYISIILLKNLKIQCKHKIKTLTKPGTERLKGGFLKEVKHINRDQKGKWNTSCCVVDWGAKNLAIGL